MSIGDVAPDFTAPGTGARSYRLHEYLGRPVVLVFYPGDATPTCTEQLTSYTTDFGQFAQLGATVLALSPQNVDSHERFQADHNFAFPLLYDEEKKVALAYGVIGPIGFYRRSVFVVDAKGIIVYARRVTAGLSYPGTPEVVNALRQAGADSAA